MLHQIQQFFWKDQIELIFPPSPAQIFLVYIHTIYLNNNATF